jgi:hypothetical protein
MKAVGGEMEACKSELQSNSQVTSLFRRQGVKKGKGEREKDPEREREYVYERERETRRGRISFGMCVVRVSVRKTESHESFHACCD